MAVYEPTFQEIIREMFCNPALYLIIFGILVLTGTFILGSIISIALIIILLLLGIHMFYVTKNMLLRIRLIQQTQMERTVDYNNISSMVTDMENKYRG